MNVGFRVFRAGFTNTQVVVRAVPSADLGGPASCLGVRGSVRVVVVLAPTGQVCRRVEVTIQAMFVNADEHPISQAQIAATYTAD